MVKYVASLGLIVLVAACGEVEAIDNDAGVVADALVGAVDAPIGAVDAAGPDARNPLELILQAVPSLPGIPMGSGRLVVLWVQLDDDGPDPELEKGYDAKFDPTVTEYRIPMSALTPPTDKNMLCPRSCNDEATCPCVGQPQVGMAYIMLLTDPNNDGMISIPDEFGYNGGQGPNPSTIFGITKILIVFSEMDYPNALPYDNIFPDGIQQGLVPYLATPPPPPAVGFDQLIPAELMTTYDLVACNPAQVTTCDTLPWPNLT